MIVSGASEGIGRATARLLTQQEAKVALVARSTDKLRQSFAELPGSLVVPTDMRDETAIHAMVKQVHQQYGHIDVLVNNAGQGMHVPLAQGNVQQYRALFDLNVVGVLAAMQAVIPVMRAQPDGGVSLTSVLAPNTP